MSTTEDVITSLGKWKYLLKTDLKSAYFQIKMDRDSQQWLGTNSPYKGLKNMAEFLEEIVARILSSCLAEGYITKISDDLIIGGNTVDELLSNWTNVLEELNDNNVSLLKRRWFALRSTQLAGYGNNENVTSVLIVSTPFQVASISDKGVLVHRKNNLYGNNFELIIVPQDLAPGLISALHIKLSHPKKGQLKRVWDRHLFAMNSDRLIEDCPQYALCSSLKSLPWELFKQALQTFQMR